MGDNYYSAFQNPSMIIHTSLLKSRAKKRALNHRLCDQSPSKKSKPSPVKVKKRPFGKLTPQENATPIAVNNTSTSEIDLYEEDSCLLELFKSTTKPAPLPPPRPLPSNENDTSPPTNVPTTRCYLDFIQTPPTIYAQKKRQKLTPAPVGSSPSWGSENTNLNINAKPSTFVLGGAKKTSIKGRNLLGRFVDEADSILESEWSPNPCLDWSLKTKISVISSKPFGFNSAGLKSSEESSGTSAFARCIDIDPNKQLRPQSEELSPVGSQLDTSLGAQFHKCCLIWQHPSLPAISLFPRENSNFSFASATSSSVPLNGIRMEQKVLNEMFLEWVDALRSLFQLLRTRQCPYFYVCANQFTCLFSAAGTQGKDFLQVYVTPSTKGFRDLLNHEGIEFTTPCSSPADETKASQFDKEMDDNQKESDQEADKWLNEMGISQDVSLSHNLKSSPASTADEKNKAALVVISGTNTLAFFNFLINSKNLLVPASGPFAGLPPTILSPVAFHGATLKKLKVKQSRSGKSTTGDISYCIDIVGPILPHVIHMLCPVLRKTVHDFKIRTSTLNPTTNLNLNARFHSSSTVPVNAFELQNLSDCGLNKAILEIFCKPDNIATINNIIECKDGMYQWS